MKTFHFSSVLLFGLALIGVSLSQAAPDKNIPDELTLEPLSLTVSKLARDNFGKGVNPFGMMAGAEISGTSILAKINRPRTFKAHLVESGAKLSSFRDDKGKDLLKLPKGQRLNDFWEPNKPLSVLGSSSRTGVSGLRLRAPLTPSPDATRIIVEGTLSFAMVGDLQQAEHEGVALEAGKTLKSNAATLVISQGKADQGGEKLWWIELRPNPDAVNVELEIFGKDADDLILDTDGDKRPARRSMNGIVSYGFACEKDSLHRVVVHFAKQGEKVQIPFKLETDLGGFQGGQEDQGNLRRPPGPQPKRPADPAGKPPLG